MPLEAGEGGEIRRATDASRRDERLVGRLEQHLVTLEVGTFERAVASDVVDHDRAEIKFGKALHRIEERNPARALPPRDRDRARSRVVAAVIEAEHHAAGMRSGEAFEEVAVAERGGPEHHTRGTEAEQLLRALFAPHPAGHLDRYRDALQDASDDLAVQRLTGARRVEIDEVDERRSRLRVRLRLRERVSVRCLGSERAALEPHRLTFPQIDGGDDLHR